MATNITPEQRDGILKVVVGLFDAAPGGIYLNDLAAAVQAGMTNQQLADLLSNHPIFINEVLGGRVTSIDKVNLLMKNFGLTADSDPNSAGSQAKAYFEAKLNAGDSIGKVVVDAATYLSGTVAPEFETTKNLFLNKVAVAAPFSILSNSTDLDVLQNAFSQVTGDHLYTAGEAQAIAETIAAVTQVLTTGTDNITGTAGGDILIGDSATTAQTADQVDLGSGADTLKMIGDTASVATLPTMKNVETIQILKATGALDFTNYTKALTGVTTIQIDDASAAGTLTTTDGQSLNLATAGGKAAVDTEWKGSSTDTASTLTLSGYQGAADAGTTKDLKITAAAVTTQTIVSNGTTNNILNLQLGALTDKLVITGSGDLNVFDDVVSGTATTLKTIDASAATGDVDLTLAAATNKAFAFTGGAGDDGLTLAVGGVTALTAGSQLDGGAGNDTLGVAETAALSVADAAKVNATKGFETLAFTASGSGVDVSAITNTSITSFKVNTGNLSETFTNANSKSNFIIDNSAGNTGEVKIANKVGENSTNITLDSASATTDQTLTKLTLSGAPNVTLTSTGDAKNIITTLGNTDNSVLTIKGDAALTFTIAATATGSKVDGSAATGKLAITGNAGAYASGSSLGDVIIGGTAADTLKSGKNSSTLTGNADNDTFDVSVAVAAADFKEITTITDFTKGDIIQFGATAGAFTKTKVDLSTATTEAGALDLLAAGSNTDLKWGVYGGNTYIVDDVDAGATLAATDTAVKLTGELDLSTSTIATNALTFA